MKCKLCKSSTKTWYENIFDDRHGYPGYFKVEKCTKCNFAQTSPQIPKSKISKLYESYYPRNNIKVADIKLRDYKNKNYLKLWRKGLFTSCEYHIPRGASYKVLDVGCGVGYSLLHLKNMGHKPFGIDPDSFGKKIAEKYSIPFYIGFIEDKPFNGEKFDYVIASQVLEHTNNPNKFITDCVMRLNESGKLIVSFPNVNSITRMILNRRWLHWHIPYHLNHFSKKNIFLLAEKNDLSVEQIKTVTPNMWTSIQIFSLLKKHKPGVRDTFWDGGSSKSKSYSGLLSKLVHMQEEYNLINRAIDSIGFGESFVVTFSKK